jgi:hypothetical protein
VLESKCREEVFLDSAFAALIERHPLLTAKL